MPSSGRKGAPFNVNMGYAISKMCVSPFLGGQWPQTPPMARICLVEKKLATIVSAVRHLGGSFKGPRRRHTQLPSGFRPFFPSFLFGKGSPFWGRVPLFSHSFFGRKGSLFVHSFFWGDGCPFKVNQQEKGAPVLFSFFYGGKGSGSFKVNQQRKGALFFPWKSTGHLSPS